MDPPMRAPTGFRTAILHQGAPVPAVGGVVKPFKPGGYTDSSADLAFALRSRGVSIITPVPNPDPSKDADWSFPDSIAGVGDALRKGANALWANTTLHSQHSLVSLRDELQGVRMVGQNPLDTEKYEDKEWINRWLESQPPLTGSFPRSMLFSKDDSMARLEEFGLPMVLKPIRGRGSHGVTLVKTKEEMERTAKALLDESDAILVEEYCAGEECTVTVMPPGEYDTVGHRDKHWSLPLVTRFGHHDGIAPYNGVVAVTANSRALSAKEHDADPAYREVQRKCEIVAELCHATAPIRVDVRRKEEGGEFTLFDVNMKPNATGPGRPGREAQASLTTMAASEIGWDYGDLVVNILRQARLISDVIRQA